MNSAQHGLSDDALHAVFQAIVINRLSYASPAWWGFATADDRHRLEAFLCRSARLGYRVNSSATFASICDEADDQLFECPDKSTPADWSAHGGGAGTIVGPPSDGTEQIGPAGDSIVAHGPAV